MRFAAKILLPAAIIAAVFGAVAALSQQRAARTTPLAKGPAETVNTPQRSADDALQADASWVRWPSVTDF